MKRSGKLVDSIFALANLHANTLQHGETGSARLAMAETEGQMNEALNALSQSFDTAADRELWGALRSRADELKRLRFEVDESVKAGDAKAARAMLAEKVAPLDQQMLKQASDFRVELRRRRAEDAALAGHSAFRDKSVILSLGLITLAMLGGFVFLIRKMTTDLTGVAVGLARGAQQITDAASQVNSISHSLARGASEQAASLEETSASAEEINAMVSLNARNSEETARLTTLSEKLLSEANLKLDQMLASMRDISDSSEKISKIIRVIDEIAFQTNMLSLNAAVEAARAGEAGMGFAVVADEVRGLAQRCSRAARDTSALIEESIDHARVGSIRVDEVAMAMRQVTETSTTVGQLSQDLSVSSAEQARGIQQISIAISQIQMVTQKNASDAEQGATAGSQMTDEAQRLKSTVEHLQSLVGIGK